MKRIGVLIMLVLLASSAHAASRITDIDLSDKRIKETDSFRIEVTVKNPESGMILEFYVNKDKINTVNVGSSKDDYESNTIDLKDEPLGCGTHIAKAVLKYRENDEEISSLSMDFSIGNLPNIRIEPERPLVNKDVKIYLTDPETKSPVVGVKIQIDYTVNWEDKTSKGSTNIEGYRSFTPVTYGRYDIIIDDNEYCGETRFYAKNILRMDGPHPENPVVGELVHLAVPMGVGVKVLDKNGDKYLTAFTTAGGGANFTINESGNYTLVVGELNSRYWGINKNMTVAKRPVPEIEFNPTTAVVGKSISLSVTSRDSPLTDADITISGPDKSFDDFVTPSSGKISFTPMSVGEYTITVEKPRYDSISQAVLVKNELYLEIEPKVPAVGGNVTLIVRNQLGHVVAAVAVLLDDEEMGITDAGGRYTLRLAEPKNYTIKASKRDIRYWDAEIKVAPATELRIELESELVRVGDFTQVIVYDKLGTPIEAGLTAKDPEGKTTQINANTFTPTTHGVHTIIATKIGYGTTSKEVEVKASPINVDWNSKGRNLILTLTSNNKPVKDITVAFSEPVEGTLKTKSDGTISLPLKTSGKYIIEVNKVEKNEDYESKTESRTIKKDYRIWLLLFLVMIVIAGAFIVVYIIHKKLGLGSGKNTVQTKLDSKSSLRSV